MKINKLLLLPIIGLAFLNTSCEDTSLEDLLADKEGELAKKYIKAEASISNLYAIVDLARRDSLLMQNDSSEIYGAMSSRSGSTITLDFGKGVLGPDGIKRSGKITIDETGDYLSNGSMNVNFMDYTVADIPVSGKVSLQKAGGAINLSLTDFSADDDMQISAVKLINWESGFFTFYDNSDDVYAISGTATAKSKNETTEITSNISEALKYNRSCDHKLLQGIIEIEIKGDTTNADISGAIDFVEDDGCDNIVKVKIEKNGSSIEIPQTFKGF